MDFDITTSEKFKVMQGQNILEYKDYLIYERHLMENTVNGYIFRVYKFFLFLNRDLKDTTREDIKDFVKYLKLREYEASTLTTYICSLKSYFGYLLYKDEKNESLLSISYLLNHTIKIKKYRRVPPIPNLNEVNILRETMLRQKSLQSTNPNKFLYNIILRDIALLELLLATGARSAEIRNLRLVDIDFENSSIFIKEGKGGHQRMSLFDSIALKAVKEHICNKNLSPNDFIFPMSQGNMLNYIIKRWAKRAKINSRIHAHSLRYFHIIEAQVRGVNIQSVADQVGHVNLNTTRYYTHLHLNHRRDQYKGYFA